MLDRGFCWVVPALTVAIQDLHDQGTNNNHARKKRPHRKARLRKDSLTGVDCGSPLGTGRRLCDQPEVAPDAIIN